jgi:predicted transposase YbfD/YdcC
MLEIVFREEECRERRGNEALNLNILRKTALRRIKKVKMEKKWGERQTPDDACRPGFRLPV